MTVLLSRESSQSRRIPTAAELEMKTWQRFQHTMVGSDFGTIRPVTPSSSSLSYTLVGEAPLMAACEHFRPRRHFCLLPSPIAAEDAIVETLILAVAINCIKSGILQPKQKAEGDFNKIHHHLQHIFASIS